MSTKVKKKPSASKTNTLQWVSSKGHKRSYELRSGDLTAGRLHWPKMFGTLAEAEFEGERWTLKREGFLRPRVTIRTEGAEVDAAVLQLSSGGGGSLRTDSGRCFRLSREGFWTARFIFADEAGAELLRIAPKLGLLRHTGTVEVQKEGSDCPELPLLLLVGWYVIMMITDDDSSAAVVAACCT